MPATAGRVRMPANNRVHSSAALQTHGIWQSAIGYDPYAPNKEDKKDSSQNLLNAEPDAENAYASFQGLLQLAKITNAEVDISRGACKKCGRVGHLKFQCKNYVKIKDDNEEKDPEAMQPVGLVGLDKKLKAEKVDRRNNVESSEEEEEDSESSDSEIDSEIERIIAERSGKKISGKRGSSRKKGDLDDDGSDKDSGKRRKRGRSKKRSVKREVSDSDDSGERRRRRKRRREHRRKKDKSPDEDDEYRCRHRKSRKEKRRRRSRLSDSDSSEDSTIRHKRKNKRALSSSDTDSSGYNDSRKGRDVNKSGKRRSRHHGDDE
ncbi:CAX-interacting protein 4 [Spatholobus suberectus]|nr:CAX-interacting protein 4 [Spatholobus suberectus]